MSRTSQAFLTARHATGRHAVAHTPVRIYRGTSRMTLVGRMDQVLSAIDRLIAQEYAEKSTALD